MACDFLAASIIATVLNMARLEGKANQKPSPHIQHILELPFWFCSTLEMVAMFSKCICSVVVKPLLKTKQV